jgi:hypothetical protein
MGKIPNDPTQPLAEMLKSTGCFTVVQHSHTMQQEMARAGGRIPTVDYVLRPKVDNKSNGAASTFGSFGLAAVGTALTFLVPPVGLASLVVANGVKTDNIEVVLNVGEPRTGEEWRLTGASSNVRIVHAFAYSWGADNPELAKAVEDVVSKFSAKVLPASATAKPASAPVRTVATR